MDTMADPLGVCIHRKSFIDAHIRVNISRPSASQKNNAVDSSEKDTDVGQTISCSTGDVQGKVLHFAGSIIGGNTSIIWPNADRSSTALIPPEVFTLQKRSRSCNDLVETSATVPRLYSQESGALRTRDANMSWTNNLRETDVDGHASDSKSHKPPDLPYHDPNDSRLIKEEDYNSSQEIRDVKTHMAHNRFAQLEKGETEPTQLLMGLLPTNQPMNEPRVSTAFSRTTMETKRIEKEDGEILLAVRCKTPKQGTGDVGTGIHARGVVDDAGVLSQPVTLEASSSKFDASDYLSIDWQFFPQDHPPSICIGVDTSKYTDRRDGRVNVEPKPRKSAASSLKILDRSEDLNISASSFVSALDKLNEIVPNCDSKKTRPNIDAMKRFQRDPNRCLGNTMKGEKCRRRNRSEDRQKIRQLLTGLAAMNFENNTQRCVDELVELIKMAFCSYQRATLTRKIRLLVPPDPPKDSASPSAGPIIKEAIKGKVRALPGRILTGDESRITGERKAQAAVSPVALSTPKITYWLRASSRTTLVYLPDYRRYKTAKSSCSDVRGWVIQQAKKPLTPRELHTGYLYVYWNQATFGVCKIGYTTLDVSTRLRQWETKCKHTAQEQYRSPFEVRNVKRLERLVHAELKEYRLKEYGCHGCLGNHDEWFTGVDFKIILESIEFWTKWIMKEQGQYEKVKGKWLLKEDAKEELPQLCNRLSVVNAEESKATSITITPRRHNLRPRVAKRSSSYKSRGNW